MNKNWILTIGIDKFYLTDEEKDFYLVSISHGNKYVSFQDKILGANLQSLVNISITEETKMIESGKKKCEFGKWHSVLRNCSCNLHILIDGNTAKITSEDSNSEI